MHGFHKIIVHHNSFKHYNKKKYFLISISANYKKLYLKNILKQFFFKYCNNISQYDCFTTFSVK